MAVSKIEGIPEIELVLRRSSPFTEVFEIKNLIPVALSLQRNPRLLTRYLQISLKNRVYCDKRFDRQLISLWRGEAGVKRLFKRFCKKYVLCDVCYKSNIFSITKMTISQIVVLNCEKCGSIKMLKSSDKLVKYIKRYRIQWTESLEKQEEKAAVENIEGQLLGKDVQQKQNKFDILNTNVPLSDAVGLMDLEELLTYINVQNLSNDTAVF